ILTEEPKSADEIAALGEQDRVAYIQAETSSVKGPYLILGLVILAITAVFVLTRLPDVKEDEQSQSTGVFRAFRHKNVTWAVIAQFFYVGAQVCVLSFLVMFATDVAGIDRKSTRLNS